MGVAHLALELGPGHQRGDAVDHQHVDGPGAHQGVGDLKRLLARVRLGDQELLHIDPELGRVIRVQDVLGVDEGTGAALALGFGDDVERQRGLARALRSVDLDDAAAWQAADAERDVEAEGTG